MKQWPASLLLAAESVGVTAARREVTMLAAWIEDGLFILLPFTFAHWNAKTIGQLDNYMAQLFSSGPC